MLLYRVLTTAQTLIFTFNITKTATVQAIYYFITYECGIKQPAAAVV